MTASSGIEQEESLLLETANKEASFASTVSELEKELKQVRIVLIIFIEYFYMKVE